jgi:orotate phosphoribosyltransferase
MDQYVADFVENAVRTEALTFGDFTLSSGRASRYFFNLGKAMGDGEGIAATRDAYITQLIKKLGFLEANENTDDVFFFGPAYKGIALAGVVAAGLHEKHGVNVRWGYDRKEVKDHGADANWMVGELKDGDHVVIFDDVVTTSETKREAWKKLYDTREGLTHGGVMIALDRQETDKEGNAPIPALEAEGIPVSSIIGARELFDYLHDRKVDGRVLVDDEAYEAFQGHQKEFGVKVE